MERLTKRIASHVYYTQGKYEETIPAEMETNDIRNVLKKLAEYEDLEEQGLLLRLPCKVGDKVYMLKKIVECKFDYDCKLPCLQRFKCEEGYGCEYEYGVYVIREKIFDVAMLDIIGKTVFLTRAEAEQALERMEK